MAVRVLSDNLPNRAAGAAAQEAVLGAIGAPDGDWRVQIHEGKDSASWHITIWGPNGFRHLRAKADKIVVDVYAAIPSS